MLPPPSLSALDVSKLAEAVAAIAESDADELAGPEFLRAVRSLHINAAKETSAARAAAEVTE